MKKKINWYDRFKRFIRDQRDLVIINKHVKQLNAEAAESLEWQTPIDEE